MAIAKYLHKKLIKDGGYNKIGKVSNDYRITRIGRFLRKYYLDEIPQLINLLKGDIKLVGCRPVGTFFLTNYPENTYKMRLSHKPGIISPAIADNARKIEDVIISEHRFLSDLSEKPFATKQKVLTRAFRNVLTGKINSQ